MPDDTALLGVRVIDLSEGIAGPFCAKLLAAAGAEVIKVEPPAGEVSRQYGPFPGDAPHPEKSGLFLHLNTGKKSVILDIAQGHDRAELRRLLAGADLLVESFPPGHLASLGLGFEQLKDDFPQLIGVSVTPFGQTGPYRDYRATSALTMALTAIMYQSGDPDKAPLATAGDPVDYFAGFNAWLGALAALLHRGRTSHGQQVDVSHWDAMGVADDFTTTLYAFMGAIRRRFHSRQILTYPGDLFPCRNGHIMVTGGHTGFPSGLAILIERPELFDHPLFNDTWARVLNPDAFDDLILPWLREHDWQEILARAQELRIPFAPCLGPQELLENEHLRAREFFVRLDHPDAGPLPYAGAPFRMSATPLRFTRAPRLGEHNGASWAT
jgi:crotonobetainyl-CoA:carnitine CoA-transferase CaiB-like acyl-CoA transferase